MRRRGTAWADEGPLAGQTNEPDSLEASPGTPGENNGFPNAAGRCLFVAPTIDHLRLLRDRLRLLRRRWAAGAVKGPLAVAAPMGDRLRLLRDRLQLLSRRGTSGCADEGQTWADDVGQTWADDGHTQKTIQETPKDPQGLAEKTSAPQTSPLQPGDAKLTMKTCADDKMLALLRR